MDRHKAAMGSGFDLGGVRQAFANQAAYCLANDSPVTARLVTAIATLLDAPQPGTFVARIRDWAGPVLADAVPLRSAGGLHALHMSGAAPELDAIYAGAPADDVAVIAAAVRRHEPFLLPWLDGPPQTNEAGRSSGFIAALLWLAGQGLPSRFECLEIGSSAGINLMLDRYHYELGGVETGPADSAMRFAPQWRGPPPDRELSFVSLKGCDVAPVDLTDSQAVLRLKAYIWPELAFRFARLEEAIAAARIRPPNLVAMNAADFVEQELARPQAAGTTRVLMHSIVWQYVPEDQQARVTAAMEAAGEAATRDRALAWVSLEANRTLLKHELTVRLWPGDGERHLLANAQAHGARVEWLAG